MRNLTRNNSICPQPEAILLESVKNNDLDKVRVLINSDRELLNYEYPFTSKTILLTACTEEGVEASTIDCLINLGASLQGNAEWNPLHLAAQNPNSSILEVILKYLQPGQINEKIEGNTALIALIKSGSIKNNEERFCRNVELLLKAGINVNEGDGKNLSAILWAAKNEYKQIVKTILEKSIGHVDLDNHKLRNKSARDLIIEKKLYDKPLPEPICQNSIEICLSLVKEGKEDDFINFFNHLSNLKDYVNWEDGAMTLLQYSCEKGMTKIAKYLIDKGADINKGHKAPIELVAENGFYEIFEKLVNCPNVKITPDIICSLLRHADNPKFHKIDHEKCCDILLNKLKENKHMVDVNAEDELTNTPLHYALRYANESTIEKLLKLGASLACKNEFGHMPIADMKPEVLERHFDECVKFDNKNNNDEKRSFQVYLDYTSLLPPLRLGKDNDIEISAVRKTISPETEVIAYMSEAPEFKNLLAHPLIVSFLFMKWHRIRFLFYTNLLFYIVFVASLFAYIFIYYANFDALSDFSIGFGKFLYGILNITYWILIFREIFQIAVSPRTYFKNFENYVEIVLIVITGLILYIDSPTEDTRKKLASTAILLSAFELVLMLGQHPKLSTNVVMLKTVSVNFFKLLLWYSLLIIAFALSFNILFSKSENVEKKNESESDDAFTDPGKSLFKTIVMLTGEFDAGSINFQTYPFLSKLIFSIFVFMITIILLNLLNGLAVSDTQAIKTNAELVGHITRAQHIYYVESMLLGNILPSSLINTIQNVFCCFPFDKNATYNICKPIAKKICLFRNSDNCQLTVLPNEYGKIFCEFDPNHKKNLGSITKCCQACSDSYLDKETIKRIACIVKSRRKQEETFVGDNVQKMYAEISALKEKLDLVLRMQPQNDFFNK